MTSHIQQYSNSCQTVTVTVSVHQESYDGHDRYICIGNFSTGNFKITLKLPDIRQQLPHSVLTVMGVYIIWPLKDKKSKVKNDASRNIRPLLPSASKKMLSPKLEKTKTPRINTPISSNPKPILRGCRKWSMPSEYDAGPQLMNYEASLR